MRARPVANPPNRFLSTHVAYDDDAVATTPLELLDDASKTILAHNDSPDIGFEWSVNPYRGCVHACAYCYARPTHEYLGLGAGTDFDSKIVVKRRAPELLREAFDKPSWKGGLVVFSGVTDCYQAPEAQLKLTRACLEVCAEYRNPVAIITKAPLVERDVDVLQALARDARVHVRVSVPFIDKAHARALEPFVATPERRLRTIETLAKAGIPVGVNVAPVIPGLSDEQVPKILEAAREAGAAHASYVMLRLPGAVATVFEERLRAAFPERAERILNRVRDTRGGALYQPQFMVRGRGTGEHADMVARLFATSVRRLGLDRVSFGADGAGGEEGTTFRRPPRPGAQMPLF
jgi:DNA repair photolyase